MPTQSTTSYGQVIEYIQDRLYLAAYTHAPSSQTPFPYALGESSSRSPHKRSKSHNKKSPVYFSVDDSLLYNRFHADFGPLHIAHLYRFAVQLHEILGDPANSGRPVVFWSRADPRTRANAACLLACYMVLIQSWPPHLALAPISQADPPFMPFRDAGYSQADYGLSVQDVVYGVWKAKEENLCALKDFSLEEYERYERVDQGDFNWITPDFIAFASPNHEPVAPIPSNSSAYAAVPKSIPAVEASSLPEPFKNVLAHFVERNVGLVVRLNSELYSPTYFTALGIEHIDMIFDDGTCPQLPAVRRFIKMAHEMITKHKRGIAVHCKAGLGRTGCLIGAYLIYRYGFTANDLIAYMRFMRPGMVVGPQQHWLHINQGTFRQWWWEDEYKAKIALMMPSTPTKMSSPRHVHTSSKILSQTATPPNGSQASKRSALEEIDYNETRNGTLSPGKSAMDDNLPAPTPGQPRKTSRVGTSPIRNGYRAHSTSGAPFDIATDADVPPVPTVPENATEVVEVRSTSHRSRSSPGNPKVCAELPDGSSEEEWAMRRMSRRRSPGGNKSPSSLNGKPRAISYTTTTTTRTSYSVLDDGEATGGTMSDVENWDAATSPSKEGKRAKSGSGSGTIGVVKVRATGSPTRHRSGCDAKMAAAAEARVPSSHHGVRKTSGRVGSVGAKAAAAAARKDVA